MSLEVSTIGAYLIDIEADLRQLHFWQSESPDKTALASTEPFCFDTLTFPQWLQFVFIPRMYALIESGENLPDSCGIAPMAEEYFSGSDLFVRPLLTHLASLDSYISHSSSRDV
ncbi:MAG: YqcC family protein [Pseudomonadales bacterium]